MQHKNERKKKQIPKQMKEIKEEKNKNGWMQMEYKWLGTSKNGIANGIRDKIVCIDI